MMWLRCQRSMRPTLLVAFLVCQCLTITGQIPRPSVCDGSVLNLKATYLPDPLYPLELKALISAQTLSVRVEVNEHGFVTSAKACSGHEKLRQYAEDAAIKARVAPTTLSGVPVKVKGLFIFRFDSATSYSKPYKLSCEPSMNILKILNGYALELKEPDYPKELREQRITGAVNVQVLVDKHGKVSEANAVSGPEPLRKFAVYAVRNSIFRKFERCGKPVEISSIVTYNFPPLK